jgi:hypothetical protein
MKQLLAVTGQDFANLLCRGLLLTQTTLRYNRGSGRRYAEEDVGITYANIRHAITSYRPPHPDQRVSAPVPSFVNPASEDHDRERVIQSSPSPETITITARRK